MAAGGHTMDRDEKSHLAEEGDGDLWQPVQRERSHTTGSQSESSGLKRRKQPQPPPNQVLEEKEPSTKRIKPVTKGLSAASSSPQPKVTPLKKLGLSIQRSIGSKNDSRLFNFSPRTRSWDPGTGPKKRSSKLWSETFSNAREELSSREIKRQEVIFELMQGENMLIEDLNLVKKNYYEPMLKLEILSLDELNQIFGIIDTLPPLHQDLLERLARLRHDDGRVQQIGPTLMEWLPCLNSYSTYCCNQVAAKALLDHKRNSAPVQNFLRLCQESAFSRKLDVWSFLDLPRSRLVKYPLLLKELLKHTALDHPDHTPLSQSKLHVFLFEAVLVLTRPVSHNDQLQYQVYRQPIPLLELVLEDLPDGEVRVGGSIRGAFTTANEKAKNFFRVSFRDRSRGQAHTLQANDSFNKQQWISSIRQAMISCREHGASEGPSRETPCTVIDISDLSLSCQEDCQG
ncbi:rho guanine nucleotide exchange factor 3-like [Pelobates cultripes]|uniref:Rho guanine nucleotide exchange factor 3-like n=1 Tax=Pelobates cultripes TaxID=61616 RepID=A0AAD1T8R7_PELCU|nr:rho guanine nucleotide exchange factor 3-like [Pelobates cultripes]